MSNYFSLFSLPLSFDIDLAVLEASYDIQIAKFYPDKFVMHSEKDQAIALKNTSLLNTAFNTLNSDISRASYLLKLNGVDAFCEQDTKMNHQFLMEQIELREHLEFIKDESELADFIKNINLKIKKHTAQIKHFFCVNDLEEVKNLVRELKFYKQLNNKANSLI